MVENIDFAPMRAERERSNFCLEEIRCGDMFKL